MNQQTAFSGCLGYLDDSTKTFDLIRASNDTPIFYPKNNEVSDTVVCPIRSIRCVFPVALAAHAKRKFIKPQLG
ncbi:hypothetical protein [Methylobacter sp.]|uniref:hypothetical protein n=1 Tax=Methylobacter sp. TaxID=2051955 RepID=UPI002FDEEE5C